MIVATCLRSGGEYKPEHVDRLRGMVGDADFVCLSDVEVNCRRIPLKHDWSGWWAKMELFAPWVKGDLLYFDLDTTIFRLPSIPMRSAVLRDFMNQGQIGSGMMFLKEADRAAVWDAFIADPIRHMRECRTPNRWGDQGFIEPFFSDALRWQDFAKVYSYKMHCRNSVPQDADVVCFHGKPRPWDICELQHPRYNGSGKD